MLSVFVFAAKRMMKGAPTLTSFALEPKGASNFQKLFLRDLILEKIAPSRASEKRGQSCHD